MERNTKAREEGKDWKRGVRARKEGVRAQKREEEWRKTRRKRRDRTGGSRCEEAEGHRA